MVQTRTKWCDCLVEHRYRSRTRSGNGRPTPSLGQADRHGHKAGSSTRTRTPPGGRGISASAQLPTPQKQKEGRSQPLRTTQPGSGGSANHRGGAPCCAGPRLTGCAYQYESDQEVLGGRGSALGQATDHWGGQIACPSRRFPTPMRVSYPDASLLPRCESPTPMRVSCPDTARRIRKGPAAGNRSARRTPRTRAHSPGPLGISARSAASRSGTS